MRVLVGFCAYELYLLMQCGFMIVCLCCQVDALFDAVRHAVAKCPKDLSDSSGSATNLYEVLYVGKAVVSTKKAPPSFIDDAVAKFDEVSKQVDGTLFMLQLFSECFMCVDMCCINCILENLSVRMHYTVLHGSRKTGEKQV